MPGNVAPQRATLNLQFVNRAVFDDKLRAMTDTSPTQYPSLMRRLTAMLYDGLLVVALVAVVNALALGIAHQISGGAAQTLPPIAVRIITVATVFAFFTVFWLKDGQTLGMQAWRIKLVATGDKRLTLGRALLRCCAAVLSLACLGLGYLWCLFDAQGRYWHCHLSGTQLVLLPKPAKQTKPAKPDKSSKQGVAGGKSKDAA